MLMYGDMLYATVVVVQLNIDYPTTSGQATVRRCSDKANVPDKKTHCKYMYMYIVNRIECYFSKFSYFLNGSLHAQCVLYGTCAQKNCYG